MLCLVLELNMKFYYLINLILVRFKFIDLISNGIRALSSDKIKRMNDNIMLKFLLFKEIGITKFKEIRKIILFYFRNNININYLKISEDNIEVYDLEQFDKEYWFNGK